MDGDWYSCVDSGDIAKTSANENVALTYAIPSPICPAPITAAFLMGAAAAAAAAAMVIAVV